MVTGWPTATLAAVSPLISVYLKVVELEHQIRRRRQGVVGSALADEQDTGDGDTGNEFLRGGADIDEHLVDRAECGFRAGQRRHPQRQVLLLMGRHPGDPVPSAVDLRWSASGREASSHDEREKSTCRDLGQNSCLPIGCCRVNRARQQNEATDVMNSAGITDLVVRPVGPAPR